MSERDDLPKMIKLHHALIDAAVTLDGRGHSIGGLRRTLGVTAADVVDGFDLALRLLDVTDADIDRLSAAQVSGVPLTDPVTVTFTLGDLCSYCEQGSYTFDGFRLAAADACPHPDGLNVNVSIDVPSGKLAVANSMHAQFSDGGAGSMFGMLSVKRSIEAYAADGCLVANVGNSCPSLYETGADRFVLAAAAYDEHDRPALPAGAGRAVATVITDAWTVCIADADLFVARGGTIDDHVTVVPVTAGRYEMEFYGAQRSFTNDYGSIPVTYATISRVS